MRSAALAALLAAALALLALLAAPASGYVSSSAPAFRFAHARSRALEKEQVRAFEGVTNAQGLLDALAKVKVGKWGTEENAVGALAVLRAIVALNPAPVTEAAMWEAQTVKAANKNKEVAGQGSGASKAIFEWTNLLRQNFLVGAAGSARPKALVRGAGPGGLAAALYLRLKTDAGGAGLASVSVYDNRDAYTRGHYVTLKAQKTLTGGGDGDFTQPTTIEGMSNLLHTLVGADKLHDLVWKFTPNGEDPTISTSDLEHHLALAAHVVGVSFTYKAAADQPVGNDYKTKKAILEAFEFDHSNGQKFNKLEVAGEAKCANPGNVDLAKRDAVSDNDIANHDVIIVAEGTGSHSRAYSNLFKKAPGGEGEAPNFGLGKFHTSAAQGASTKAKISNLIETNGALPNFAFVLEPSTILKGDSPYTPVGTADNSQLRAAPFMKKQLTDAKPKYLMAEFKFKVKAGQRLLTALSKDCSYNYNVQSESRSKYADEFSRLRLAYHVFSEGATWEGQAETDRTKNAKSLFRKVKEIKMWATGFRIAHLGNKNSEVFVGYLRPESALNRNDHKLALLIGDSAREALPDDGMGANDAHHTARLAAEAAAKWTATYSACKDEVEEAISELKDHTQNVAAAIQFKDADAYETAKLGDGGSSANLVSLMKNGGKFKIGGGKVHYPEGL